MRAFTLVEVVISVSILAVLLMFLVGVLPSAVLTQQRGSALQAATAYAVEVMEDFKSRPTPAGPYPVRDEWLAVRLNAVQYRVSRDIYLVEGEGTARLLEGVVVVTWGGTGSPLTLRERVYRRR